MWHRARPLVPPAQDRHPLPLGQQPFSQENNEGSFSRPSDRQIAHAHDATGQPCGREPAIPITPQPKSDDKAVQPGNPVKPFTDRLSRMQEWHISPHYS